MTSRWHIWIDTGGTFTDCLARDPAGRLHKAKILSSSALRGTVVRQAGETELQIRAAWQVPKDFLRGFRLHPLGAGDGDIRVAGNTAGGTTLRLAQPPPQPLTAGLPVELRSNEEVPVLAARLVTQSGAGQPLPPLDMRLATTRGTNALLERKGVPTAFFVTRGFADLLLIGDQQRPDLFALEIVKPAPFYDTVIEVPERLDTDGRIVLPLSAAALEEAVRETLARGITSAAVALLHSYVNPAHEEQLGDYLLEAGFTHVSLSSRIAPFIKIVPRAETTVVNAYLAPVIESYLSRVRETVTQGSLHVMTSAGGLVQPAAFHAKDSLLSGPAGGVVGAAHSAQKSGFSKIIAFDMGGTSTDACRFDGDYEYVFEHEVGDAHLVAPALAIESVAAGGGSICAYDGHRLRVGPESAGASPGPACYGAGGPLSITDVNLLLGRLNPLQFEIPIDPAAAAARAAEILSQMQATHGKKTPHERILTGFLEIANEKMADAIRRISIRKGYDTRDYALLAFGGAGGQHACGVAELLGMRTILVPTDASLLSATGIGHARIERFARRQLLQPLPALRAEIDTIFAALAEEAQHAVAREGVPHHCIGIRRRIVHARFPGQDTSLSVDVTSGAEIEAAFRSKYRAIYGYMPAARDIEIEAIHVIASDRSAEAETPTAKTVAPAAVAPEAQQRAFFHGKWQEVPVYQRERLCSGAEFDGPALVFEQHSAIVLHAGWSLRIDAAGAAILTRAPA